MTVFCKYVFTSCLCCTDSTYSQTKLKISINSKHNTKFCLLDQIIKTAAYCVHGEGGLPSPGVVSSWEIVLFIQGVRQTPFC